MSISDSGPARFDAIIVGAGVGGLYAIYRLRKLGLKVRAFEAASGVGGTWYWNRYPGCRCDVESMEYSYSFSDELQQEWHWPERYGTQPEILRYINHVADRFDLRRDIEFNTRVKAAAFDSKTNTWTIKTDTGKTVTARYCIMATGNLSTPRKRRASPVWRASRASGTTPVYGPMKGSISPDCGWGSSAPARRASSRSRSSPRQAKHLYVFQRTANFSLPARNAPLDPDKERAHKAEYPERRRAAYDTPFGIAGYPPPVKSALDATEEERLRAYEAKWAEGGSISYLYSFTDLLLNKEANDTASEFVRRKIRATVKDPKTAELLCPNDHPIGTKRLILDTDYYETYNRDNVTLVDIRSKPIQEITPDGLRTADAEYALDAIVFATGFDAMTGAMKEIDIRTDAGLSIREKWEDGPRTYLGLMIAGFPNLFMITGPQSPGVKSQMILACEQHVDWIADCLQYLRDRGLTRIEAEQDAEDAWVQHNNEVADRTLYPLANSWYVGANIPGKPRVFMPYVGGVTAYKKKCDEVAANGYEGFRFGASAEEQRFAAK